jgi:hypothetical protein
MFAEAGLFDWLQQSAIHHFLYLDPKFICDLIQMNLLHYSYLKRVLETLLEMGGKMESAYPYLLPALKDWPTYIFKILQYISRSKQPVISHQFLLQKALFFKELAAKKVNPEREMFSNIAYAIQSFLMKGSAILNQQDQVGNTSLHRKCLEGDQWAIQCLIELAQADITIKNHAGQTYIDLAHLQNLSSVQELPSKRRRPDSERY